MKFNFQTTAGVDKLKLKKHALKLEPYLQKLAEICKTKKYFEPESSINLPFDAALFQQINKLKKNKVGKNLKAILVIGIGGSNLGAKAVYDAIHGSFDLLKIARNPKLIFIDTNSATYLQHLIFWLKKEIESPEEILITIISKSGTTTETIANYEIIFNALSQKITPTRLLTRVVAITDENSKLWEEARKQKIATLAIPKMIGGRYSIFSAVGLFPLLCGGINLKKLIAGSQQMQKLCLQNDPMKNPALASAIVIYENYQNKKTINDNFIFAPELESLGKWYRQLLGESIGKNEKTGITPTISIGSTDLHSVGQLYLGGPKDKLTTFIFAHGKNKISIPTRQQFPNLVEGLNNLPIQNLLSAIYNGTKKAYQKNKLPFVEIELAQIDEFELGQFLQFKMLEVILLGQLFGVNAFDQPAVEAYKIETRKILKQK